MVLEEASVWTVDSARVMTGVVLESRTVRQALNLQATKGNDSESVGFCKRKDNG